MLLFARVECHDVLFEIVRLIPAWEGLLLSTSNVRSYHHSVGNCDRGGLGKP